MNQGEKKPSYVVNRSCKIQVVSRSNSAVLNAETTGGIGISTYLTVLPHVLSGALAADVSSTLMELRNGNTVATNAISGIAFMLLRRSTPTVMEEEIKRSIKTDAPSYEQLLVRGDDTDNRELWFIFSHIPQVHRIQGVLL